MKRKAATMPLLIGVMLLAHSGLTYAANTEQNWNCYLLKLSDDGTGQPYTISCARAALTSDVQYIEGNSDARTVAVRGKVADLAATPETVGKWDANVQGPGGVMSESYKGKAPTACVKAANVADQRIIAHWTCSAE
jgi:hypothetical protein